MSTVVEAKTARVRVLEQYEVPAREKVTRVPPFKNVVLDLEQRVNGDNTTVIPLKARGGSPFAGQPVGWIFLDPHTQSLIAICMESMKTINFTTDVGTNMEVIAPQNYRVLAISPEGYTGLATEAQFSDESLQQAARGDVDQLTEEADAIVQAQDVANKQAGKYYSFAAAHSDITALRKLFDDMSATLHLRFRSIKSRRFPIETSDQKSFEESQPQEMSSLIQTLSTMTQRLYANDKDAQDLAEVVPTKQLDMSISPTFFSAESGKYSWGFTLGNEASVSAYVYPTENGAMIQAEVKDQFDRFVTYRFSPNGKLLLVDKDGSTYPVTSKQKELTDAASWLVPYLEEGLHAAVGQSMGNVPEQIRGVLFQITPTRLRDKFHIVSDNSVLLPNQTMPLLLKGLDQYENPTFTFPVKGVGEAQPREVSMEMYQNELHLHVKALRALSYNGETLLRPIEETYRIKVEKNKGRVQKQNEFIAVNEDETGQWRDVHNDTRKKVLTLAHAALTELGSFQKNIDAAVHATLGRFVKDEKPKEDVRVEEHLPAWYDSEEHKIAIDKAAAKGTNYSVGVIPGIKGIPFEQVGEPKPTEPEDEWLNGERAA